MAKAQGSRTEMCLLSLASRFQSRKALDERVELQMIDVQTVILLSNGIHMSIDLRIEGQSQHRSKVEMGEDDPMESAGNYQIGAGNSFQKTARALIRGAGKGLNCVGINCTAKDLGLKVIDGCRIG